MQVYRKARPYGSQRALHEITGDRSRNAKKGKSGFLFFIKESGLGLFLSLLLVVGLPVGLGVIKHLKQGHTHNTAKFDALPEYNVIKFKDGKPILEEFKEGKNFFTHVIPVAELDGGAVMLLNLKLGSGNLLYIYTMRGDKNFLLPIESSEIFKSGRPSDQRQDSAIDKALAR